MGGVLDGSQMKVMRAVVGSACLILWSAGLTEGKVWHVCQKEAAGVAAADQVRTIGEAVSRVSPGDTVLIHDGVYRERVVIETSGRPDAPIRFEAATGASVIMTGADLITEWEEAGGDGRVYSAPCAHRFIPWNRSGTHPADDFHLLIGRCEQVFVNGYALRQVLERDKLTRGTFYADTEGKRLWAWSADNRPLSGGRAVVEASVRDRILAVRGNHITIKGIRFRYAANRAQQGAVEFKGNGLAVEDCVFEYANSSGAEFSGHDIVVRRCVFQHNGQLGFGANRAHGLLLSGCTVRDNNVKGFDRGWEAGGNKICMTRGAVIEHSIFVENRGNGIWFDIGNEDCTVRNCLIAHNEDAGIFYEISYGLRAHDNVILGNGLSDTAGAWGANAGISLSSSPSCRIERNLLVGNREGFSFREQKRSTPRIDGAGSEAVWNHDEVVCNNVIAYNRDAQTWGWFDMDDGRHWPAAMRQGEAGGLGLEELGITMRGNVYYAGGGGGLLNWGVTWKRHKRYGSLDDVRRELGLEKGSIVAEVRFRDVWGMDLRIDADSPAAKAGCYPRGEVPGVQLGVVEP